MNMDKRKNILIDFIEWYSSVDSRDSLEDNIDQYLNEHPQEEEGGWISLKDRHPDYKLDVLVANGCDIRVAMKLLSDSFYYYGNNNYLNPKTITHWRPLPKPPIN